MVNDESRIVQKAEDEEQVEKPSEISRPLAGREHGVADLARVVQLQRVFVVGQDIAALDELGHLAGFLLIAVDFENDVLVLPVLNVEENEFGGEGLVAELSADDFGRQLAADDDGQTAVDQFELGVRVFVDVFFSESVEEFDLV